MLTYHSLSILIPHVAYMREKLKRSDVFLVGGCVRDMLLGLSNDPKDIDVTLVGEPQKVAQTINKDSISFFMTEKYGTMTIIPHTEKKEQQDDNQNNTKKSNEGADEPVQYEITPFRMEAGYSDNRHPDEVYRGESIVQDAARRDFTINALYYTYLGNTDRSFSGETDISTKIVNSDLQKKGYFFSGEDGVLIVSDHGYIEQLFPKGLYDPKGFEAMDIDPETVEKGTHVIIDPFGGIVDMLAGKIKAVGNPDIRLQEDALRIMRALRFVNVLNDKLSKKNTGTISNSHTQEYFDIEKHTWKSLKKNYFRLQSVAKERIKTELDKVFKAGNPFGFIGLLDELNLLKFIFPAVHACKNVEQPVRYHPFDVYTHSLLCLNAVQDINQDYLVKYAMLYHDVGKVEQYYSYSMGLDTDEVREIFGTWLNHINCGVDMVKNDFKALGFSKKEIETIAWYVHLHMKPGEIMMAKKDNWPKKIRKILSEAGEQKVHNLLDITIADRLGQYNPLQPSSIDEVEELRDVLQTLIEQEGQFTFKAMAMDGNTLMQHFGLTPGKHIGVLLHKAFDWVLEDVQTRNTSESILSYLTPHTTNI